MGFATGGSFPASIVPMPSKVTLPGNYIDFQDAAFDAWTQQYLPELYEQEVERYGNRTLSGFLRMVGAEMPMTSDQVIWSEQNRLHVAYDGVTRVGDVITVTGNNALRVNQTVVISNGFVTAKCIISDNPGAQTATLLPYTAASLTAVFGAGVLTGFKVFVYGSEFSKGSQGMIKAIEPNVTTMQNSPVIIKDFYEVSGSDAAQIGWIEVALKMELLDTFGI